MTDKFLNFVFNSQSSKNLHHEERMRKFLNLDFNGQLSSKIKNHDLGEKVASKIIFWKKATDGKKLLRADHEWVIGYIHYSYLITGRKII